MKNYGAKLLVFLFLVTSLGFVGLPRLTANIKADEIIKAPDGNHYFIAYTDESGYHARQFSSLAALKSYRFLANTSIKYDNLDSVEIWGSSSIPVRDGIVACATQTVGSDKAGECSLIFNNKKHPFASEAVFLNSGFSYERAMFLDTSNLARGSAITLTQQTRRPGTLINDSGTVKLITSSYTTAGVPSVAVLQSWGWDFKDVLPATPTDKLLVEIEVLPTREAGQIDIEYINDNDVAESVVMLHMLSKYPDQPRNTASDQSARSEVIAFHNLLSDLEAHELRPYLTEYSVRLYDNLPSFASATMTETLIDTVYGNAEATILGVGNNAQVKQQITQQGTNYKTSVTLAYRKENGVWKVDLAESLKLEFEKLVNGNQDMGGSGFGDLRLVSAKIEQSTGVGANNLIVEIANIGSTETSAYGIIASVGGTSLIKRGIGSIYYPLKPGQSIKIKIPLIHLEQLGFLSGMYNVNIELIPFDFEDTNPDNNVASLNAQLSQSFAAKIVE